MKKAKASEPGWSLSWAQQSPIDLGKSFQTTDLPKLKFNYSKPVTGTLEGDHNFHVTSGSASVTLSGPNSKTFQLVKLHFHAPSEHSFNLNDAPFEVHLVHKAEPLSPIYPVAFVVVGILFGNPKSKATNTQSLAKTIRSFGFTAGADEKFTFVPDVLLPKDKATYYRYEGSLTTPPFTENVSWIVMRDFNVLDTAVERDVEVETQESARDLQPLNRRFVLRNFKAAFADKAGWFVGNG